MAVNHAIQIRTGFPLIYYILIQINSLTLDNLELALLDFKFYLRLKRFQECTELIESEVELNETLIMYEISEETLLTNDSINDKDDIIRLLIHHRFIKPIEAQLKALLIGFRQVIPLNWIQILGYVQLEYLISGADELCSSFLDKLNIHIQLTIMEGTEKVEALLLKQLLTENALENGEETVESIRNSIRQQTSANEGHHELNNWSENIQQQREDIQLTDSQPTVLQLQLVTEVINAKETESQSKRVSRLCTLI
ncbi:unnamed protein product [Didymodactylos carnosus]|uniref:HECT domain-containing protein n=1 Tax=Didymodactylos carnosus TaxID=1234261 RepID=A0A8S2GZS5_9BILA|nr:unnamed protein product [Didymodactylos carnosus]CAF3580730.1 unnamed protein product [Didymodactylos carnosus]